MSGEEKGKWASEGRLTPQSIAEYRQRIGKSFPTEARGKLRHASQDAIRAYSFAIGDDNPLWTSLAHGAESPWRGTIAPPSILFAVFLGEMMSGLPGVHAFHSGGDWEFLRPVRAGDTLRAECKFVGVEEHSSGFAPLWLIATYESTYFNQANDLVGKVRSTQIRVERTAMRSSSGGKAVRRAVPHPWTDSERESIEALMTAQHVRGSNVRYFEEVEIGEELPTLVKGPLRQTDIIAWLAATETLRSTNVGLREIAKHPGLGLLSGETNARESIESVHWDNAAARSAGVPGAYDLGAQRHAYMMQSITDWMGDAGFLKRNRCQYRKFVYVGDALWFGGKVTRKYVENSEACVEIESSTMNQHGENVMPGFSTVVLPSRERGSYPAASR